MNFFDHKDLGNHLLQLCPKVVKHPVFASYDAKERAIMSALNFRFKNVKEIRNMEMKFWYRVCYTFMG